MKRFRIKQCSEKGYKWLVRGKTGARRYARTYFHSKAEAQTFADRKNIEFENKGTESFEISTSTRIMAMEAESTLSPFGKTITDAVAFYVAHLQRQNRSISVKKAVLDFLAAKRTQKRILSFRYQKDLKNRLSKFANRFPDHLVANMTSGEIESWLKGLGICGVTHDNYHSILSVFFEWAKKEKLIAENPIDDVRDREPIAKTPGVFTPIQVAHLLAGATEELVPYLAFSLFCGIRPEEFHKTVIRRVQGKETREIISLDWRAASFEEGFITISAELAKTHRKRLVKMPENLIEWIKPFAQGFGAIAPLRFREKLEKLRRDLGISAWPHDVLRHSFCTYHLAHFQNEHLTALQAGHSPQILRNHYDAVASRKMAEEFFAIRPEEGSKVVSFVAG